MWVFFTMLLYTQSFASEEPPQSLYGTYTGCIDKNSATTRFLNRTDALSGTINPYLEPDICIQKNSTKKHRFCSSNGTINTEQACVDFLLTRVSLRSGGTWGKGNKAEGSGTWGGTGHTKRQEHANTLRGEVPEDAIFVGSLHLGMDSGWAYNLLKPLFDQLLETRTRALST